MQFYEQFQILEIVVGLECGGVVFCCVACFSWLLPFHFSRFQKCWHERKKSCATSRNKIWKQLLLVAAIVCHEHSQRPVQNRLHCHRTMHQLKIPQRRHSQSRRPHRRLTAAMAKISKISPYRCGAWCQIPFILWRVLELVWNSWLCLVSSCFYQNIWKHNFRLAKAKPVYSLVSARRCSSKLRSLCANNFIHLLSFYRVNSNTGCLLGHISRWMLSEAFWTQTEGCSSVCFDFQYDLSVMLWPTLFLGLRQLKNGWHNYSLLQ